MDNATDSLLRLLGELSRHRERMKSIAQLLRSGFPLAKVQHGLDFRRYGERNIIEMFFDIAIADGNSLCWWIDVEHDGTLWKVDASLRRDENRGEESLWKASYMASTVGDLFERLSVVMDEIERFANLKGKNFI